MEVVITGAKGTIGTVLREGLKGYSITSLDLPEDDVRDYQHLLEVLPNHQAIIHLAWNTKEHNARSGKIDPLDISMFINIYKAARALGIPKVIMASSVHADKFAIWDKKQGLMSVSRVPEPITPYGESKVVMEKVGRRFAKNYGLDVTCIRFGGVYPKGEEVIKGEEHVALSHRDCVSLIEKILQSPPQPGRFNVLNAVSNNQGRIHNLSNLFGWAPEDSF